MIAHISTKLHQFARCPCAPIHATKEPGHARPASSLSIRFRLSCMENSGERGARWALSGPSAPNEIWIMRTADFVGRLYYVSHRSDGVGGCCEVSPPVPHAFTTFTDALRAALAVLVDYTHEGKQAATSGRWAHPEGWRAIARSGGFQ